MRDCARILECISILSSDPFWPQDFSWLDKTCAEAIRRYRECDWLRLPHCYDYGDVCIFCGKQNPKTDPPSTEVGEAAQGMKNLAP